MPNVLAISAAVCGSMSPALFEPSVNRMITFDFVFESFIRLTQFANPKPMAVPSSIMPNSTAWKRLTNAVWSMVSGHCVKLSPANTTKPIWSLGRARIKSEPTFFAASSRLGLRSSASIVPEISRAIMMSIPSVLSDCQRLVSCGRAKATDSRITAATRSTKGTCNTHAGSAYLRSGEVLDTRSEASALRICHTYQPIIGISSSNRNKYAG